MGIADALGGIVEGAFDIAGGQLSAGQNRQTQRANADLQREFAKNGITWRVEDAKRAGLHPLAALGMIPASGQGISIGDTTGESFSHAGQSIGGALQRGLSQDDQEAISLQKKLLLSQIQESDARRLKIISDIGLDHQNKGNSNGLGTIQENSLLSGMGQTPNIPGSGLIELKAPEIMTSKANDRSVQSGTSPGSEEVYLTPDLKMIMPAGKGQTPWEQWYEMPAYEKWGWIMRSQQKYGQEWLRKFFNLSITGGTGADKDGNLKPFMDNKPLSKGPIDAIQREFKKFDFNKRKYNPFKFNRK